MLAVPEKHTRNITGGKNDMENTETKSAPTNTEPQAKAQAAAQMKAHSTALSTAQRLRLEKDGDIAVVVLDNADKGVNLVDDPFLDEMEHTLLRIAEMRAKGVVFLSAKPSVFLAGADLRRFDTIDEAALATLVDRGHRLYESIARLRIPTIAAIHGACLGGGLELALACQMRIASDSSSTKLGVPETLLGILPGWGGSTRLPRLLGLPRALGMILTGKAINGKGARKLGLVDEVVPKERLRSRAITLLRGVQSGKNQVPKRSLHFFTNAPPFAALIRHFSRKQLLAKTRGHYPAPLAALDVASRGAWCCSSVAASFEREKKAFLELARTDATRQLIRLFFLQEEAKSRRYDPAVDLAALAPVRRAAVVGAGVMGAGIAQVIASRRVPVVLSDIAPAQVAKGVQSVTRLFQEAVSRHIFTPIEARQRQDLVSVTAERVPLQHCDLVIEAAVENLDIKRKIFADLCSRTAEDTILATNTSALSITALAESEGITHPERILGIHFFNPPSRMKLVEIVVTPHTSPETVERALGFVRSLGKTPVVVKDSPGFLVNRILMPYLAEAGRLVESGVSVEAIDNAMLDYGMPMGPLRLLDEIGLDVAEHVASTMVSAFGDRFANPALLAHLVSEGKLGRKSGEGFYRYEHGKSGKKSKKNGEIPRSFADHANAAGGSLSKAQITQRLAAAMTQEAQLCLDEGITQDADSIDLALVLGTGYAPFRGGPLAAAAGLSPAHPIGSASSSASTPDRI